MLERRSAAVESTARLAEIALRAHRLVRHAVGRQLVDRDLVAVEDEPAADQTGVEDAPSARSGRSS